jgi:predicted N-acetyltransferase YhbS
MVDPGLPLGLGDGLVLRQARPADTDELASLKADHHRAIGATEPDAYMATLTRDLLERPHPTFRPEWFLVVEDTATGKIASCLCMIPQTWTYGGVSFPVSRIELVSTRPEYRRRGLVRRQMDVVHRWGDELGQLAQVILGIPWYYRQFGYEYALAYGGRRSVDLDQIDPQPEDAAEPFQLRSATAADLSFIAAVAEHGASRYAVTCTRDEALWRYELEGRSIPEHLLVVERAGDRRGEPEPVGMVAHEGELAGGGLSVIAYELISGVSWLEVTPSLLRGLSRRESTVAAGVGERCARVSFRLGEEHPVYRTHRDLDGRVAPPYAWYVRVPDLLAFVRRVAPVLEERLARSDFAGFGEELRLVFFRDGMRMVFNGGRLVELAPWREEQEGDADATFPPLSFLQVLFGRRTQPELEAVLPDCRVRSQRARLLIETLFPRQPSLIWAVM